MRRIVMFNWATAAGYFSGLDGSLSWVVPDEEQAATAAESLPGFDTVLFRRRTYELFAAFWPRALAESDSTTAPNPHHPGRRSREHRAIAVGLNEMTKLVFSRTLTSVTWKNSLLVDQFDAGEIETMKRQPGKDMIVFGSGSIVSQLTQHALIDEYQFAVCPVLLGSGRALISGVPKSLRLELLETKSVGRCPAPLCAPDIAHRRPLSSLHRAWPGADGGTILARPAQRRAHHSGARIQGGAVP